MKRSRFTFQMFQQVFFGVEGGYRPIYVQFTTGNEPGDPPPTALQIDMVCEWRISDGKVMLLEVEFESKQELEAIKEYLLKKAEEFHRDQVNRIKCLWDQTGYVLPTLENEGK